MVGADGDHRLLLACANDIVGCLYALEGAHLHAEGHGYQRDRNGHSERSAACASGRRISYGQGTGRQSSGSFDPRLATAVAELRAPSGLCRLDALYNMGPTGRRIRNAFERVTDESSMSIDIGVFDSVSSDLRVSGKSAGCRDLGRKGWANNARLVGPYTEARCFGSGFMPVVTETVNQAKAL